MVTNRGFDGFVSRGGLMTVGYETPFRFARDQIWTVGSLLARCVGSSQCFR
jgi:hypothetical protein